MAFTLDSNDLQIFYGEGRVACGKEQQSRVPIPFHLISKPEEFETHLFYLLSLNVSFQPKGFCGFNFRGEKFKTIGLADP